MPACVLRVAGRDFEPDAFLNGSPLVVKHVYRRGERRTARTVHESGGFNVVVSEVEASHVADATRFFQEHAGELCRLRTAPGLESVVLDFGREFPFGRVAAVYHHLPITLLAECVALGVAIEVSVYATS